MLTPGSPCQTRRDWRSPLLFVKLWIGVSFHYLELVLRGEPLATRSDWGSFVLLPPRAQLRLGPLGPLPLPPGTLPCLLARSFLA